MLRISFFSISRTHRLFGGTRGSLGNFQSKVGLGKFRRIQTNADTIEGINMEDTFGSLSLGERRILKGGLSTHGLSREEVDWNPPRHPQHAHASMPEPISMSLSNQARPDKIIWHCNPPAASG